MITQKMFDKKFKKHIFLNYYDYTEIVEESFTSPLYPCVLVGEDNVYKTKDSYDNRNVIFYWIEVSSYLAKVLIAHGGVVLFLYGKQFWKYQPKVKSKEFWDIDFKEDVTLRRIVDGNKKVNDFLSIRVLGDIKFIKQSNLPKTIKDFLKQQYNLPKFRSLPGISYMFID